MDRKDLLASVRAEQRLENDIEDDLADNERADRNTDSLIGYRGESLKIRRQVANRPRPAPRAAEPRQPSKSGVIGRLLDKKARGGTLSAAEQQVLAEHGGGPRESYPDGTVIEMPDGSIKTRRGGRWVNGE